jgi:hypothetical protein
MCDVMGVSPAGNYAWRGRPESPRQAANRALLAEIRKIVAWAMRDHMRAELTIAALTTGIQRQKPPPGLIHHSNRGSQYAAALLLAAGTPAEGIYSREPTRCDMPKFAGNLPQSSECLRHSTCKSSATSSLWRCVSVLAKTDFN